MALKSHTVYWQQLTDVNHLTVDACKPASTHHERWDQMYKFVQSKYIKCLEGSSTADPQQAQAKVGTNIKALHSLLEHLRCNVHISITDMTNMKLALRSFVRCNSTGKLVYSL